jgi:hypothetical protein
MFNDFLSVFERFLPWHQEKEQAEALALKAQASIRQLSGLPPSDGGDRNLIAILKHTCLLLERFVERPELLPQPEPHPDDKIEAWQPEAVNQTRSRSASAKASPSEMAIVSPLLDKPQIDTQVEVVKTPPELAIEPEPELSETARELIKLRDWVLLAQSGDNPASPQVLEAIYKKLGQILAQEGVTVIEESGPFNYERQQVISTQPTDDPDKDDWVCDTVRPGYLFEGSLIRFQEVIVYSYEDTNVSSET